VIARKNVLVRVGATAALATVFGAASTASAAAAGGPSSDGTMVTADGTGSASGSPDEMTFDLCADTHASTVSAALNTNNAAMSKVRAAMSKDGIAAADMRTTTFSIGPDYNYGSPPSGQFSIAGYHVLHCMDFILRDLSKDGKVLDDAVASGGNAIQISSVQFGLSDPTALEQRARDDAYNDADAKVMQDAQNAGMNFCNPDEVTDIENSVAQPLGAVGGSPQSVPVSAGQATVQVTVRVAERCFASQGLGAA
jgi:uncharacterized protein YggE